MSTLLRSAVIAGVLAAPVVSQAAAPTLGDVLKASGVTESGYINATYNYNNRQFDSCCFYINDGANGGFTLNQVGLTLSSTPSSGFGGVVDILGGQDAAFAVPQDGGGEILFKQAYAQYASGAFTVMGGRFVTLAGSEVIAANGNSNVTRSLLFGIQPLTHTGVRAAFKLGAVTLTGGLNNSAGFVSGTAVTYDLNPQKTIELQAAFASDMVSVALTGYKGEETPKSPTFVAQSPLLIDLVASLNLTKAISLGLNYDHKNLDDKLVNATPNSTTQDGAALYANLQATDVVRVGARAEFLNTKNTTNPATGGTTIKRKEVTLTGAYAAASNFDLVTDVRFDKDDSKPWTSGTTASDSLTTVVVSGVYKF